jgi:glucose/arabinose dehydrogenase
LYLGLGDGGGAFDPRRTAQDDRSQLGKLLATDVGAPTPKWETVMYGLRNPWRFSFDSALSEVWIADVGQDAIEEINRVALELDEPPKNLGWSAYEGSRRIGKRALAGTGEVVWPVVAYDHDDGCSVTGGVVYRGRRLRELGGRYVYGDFCTGTLWSVRPRPDGRVEDLRFEQSAKLPLLTHIGTDADGELVLAAHNGTVYRAQAPR